MSEQLDAVYDWMFKNGKQLYINGRKRTNPKQKIEFKEGFVTVGEIMYMLENMQAGSKTSFASYLVSNNMFSNTKEALSTLRDYRNRRANSATFLIRQTISDLFREWRYFYGGCIKKQNKEMVLKEYNAKLQRYWNVSHK